MTHAKQRAPYFDRKKRLEYILETTPAFGPPHKCPSCGGTGEGAYESWDGTWQRRHCALCGGSGQHRNRHIIMYREALAIVYGGLPIEGVLYPTLTPEIVASLRTKEVETSDG